MAKENKKGKKSAIGIITGILVPILIIVLIAAILYAIIDAIIRIILDTMGKVLNGVMQALAHPWKTAKKVAASIYNDFTRLYNINSFKAYEFESFRHEQLIIINQEDFTTMTDNLDAAINRDIAGLDNIMLKKMLLVYNIGNYSYKSDIIIELTDEERKACKKDSSLYYPFEMVQGKDLEQMEELPWIWEDDYKERVAQRDAYYLHTNGVLTLKNENGKELVYYTKEDLQEIYKNHFKDNVQGMITSSSYAEEIWKYLEKCYTDGNNGIKMYKEKITEEVTDWDYKDNEMWKLFGYDVANLGLSIKKELNKSKSNIIELQNINYYSLVSKYTTPVEFMVSLLEISQSKDFVNSFIELVANKTNIEVTVYRTETGEGYITKETKDETTTVKGQVGGDAKATILGRLIETEDSEGNKTQTWLGGQGELRIDCVAVEDDIDLLVTKIPKIKWNIKITNIPENVKKVMYEVADQLGGKTIYTKEPKNGSITYKDNDYFVDKYNYKNNSCSTTITKLNVTTETNYAIAITKAKTWYGTAVYPNEENITRVLKTQTDGGNNWKEIRKTSEINMLEQASYEETITPDSWGEATIFRNLGSVEIIALENWNDRISSWVSKLEGDDFAFWLTASHLGQLINQGINGDGEEVLIGNERECIRIKAAFAASEGWLDGWFYNNYAIVEIKSSYTNVKRGIVQTNVSTNLVSAPANVTDKIGTFLSLLKNKDGKYSVDASYNPNGIEVEYESLYGGTTKIGSLLLSGAEMFFELLETFDNTRGLADVMRYLLSEYNSGINYCVEEWDFEIFEPDGMITIN